MIWTEIWEGFLEEGRGCWAGLWLLRPNSGSPPAPTPTPRVFCLGSSGTLRGPESGASREEGLQRGGVGGGKEWRYREGPVSLSLSLLYLALPTSFPSVRPRLGSRLHSPSGRLRGRGPRSRGQYRRILVSSQGSASS